MNRIPASLFLSSLLLAPASFAQTAPTPVIQSTSNEVLLDVVVRDKKGKSLRDLEAASFHVTDNGEPVKITHFRLVDRSAEQADTAKQAATGAAPAKLDPLKQIRLVTLIFDHLGQDGRNLSRQAALDLVKGDPQPNVYYSVFVVDQAMNALQPFTNNRELLRKAILHATAGAFTEYASDSQRVHDELQRIVGAPAGIDGQSTVGQIGNMATGTAGPQGQGAGAIASAAAQQHMAELMLAMMQMDQSITNDASRLSIYGLLALVREQYRLPGRKTVMYFCDGLYVPPFLDEAFRSVISAANRANVSVYAVDARGLNAGAQNRAAASTLQGAMDSSRIQAQSKGGESVSADQVKVFDTAETSMRLNAENSLSELSDGTGGFLISNTNDLKKPLRQVDEDISLYYELSYSPPAMQYDGKFRKISVKLDRSDVKIQSRLGYFALPPNAGPTVSPFELPLLTALQAATPPTAITFEASAMHFRPGRDSSRCAVLVQVPMKQLTTVSEAAGVRAHLGMVALLKDAQGNVKQKFSQDLPLNVTNDKKAGLATGNFTFNRAFDLAPGAYTLETAVADYEANKAGAQRVSFIVPALEQGVTISDATLVRSFAKQATMIDPLDPFEYQGGKITPSLDTNLHAEKGAVMSIYLVVYPDPSIADKPTLLLEYLQGGKVLGGGQLALPAPEKDGRIPYVASSPIENFPPGDYEARVTAQQGSTKKASQLKFTITR